MARTINPHLFGHLETQPQLSNSQANAETNLALAKKLRDLETQMQSFQQKVTGSLHAYESKMQLVVQNQKMLHEHLRQLSDQFTQYQVIQQNKFTERKQSEARSQELIDRHQVVVQNFENRLNQLQRLAKDQELKITGYQASYEEILREIRSLRINS
jgi:hypothetical protein